MVQPAAGLDTPRTNIGDTTYLNNQQFDFDISQERSFQSPSKDRNNLLEQLQNGRRGAIRTPRSRVPLNDRRNLPGGIGGGEFTPLLKSATRNSALRGGKENVPQTPAFLRPGGLNKIPEDLSPLPAGSSVYGDDSRSASYMAATPMSQIDSSGASTPLALLPRRNEGQGILQDGNQLSLREQENVIDKIEKENFGLKLKIHFLEEALRKAGPGFSEAALKENTELKVDKVTMQRELHRYRKTLTTAERDVELYRQQILEMQEKMKRKHANEGQREELDQLRKTLEDKETEVDRLKSQHDKYGDLEDKIQDLEADLREKERAYDDKDDEVENLKDDVERQAGKISDLETDLKRAQRRAVELEEKAQSSEELEDAKIRIEELEENLESLQSRFEGIEEDRDQAVTEKDRAKANLDELQDDLQEATKDKERAESNLEELQEELANKSISTKGLSRQVEEKAARLQDDLEELRQQHGHLKQQYSAQSREFQELQEKLHDYSRDSGGREQKLQEKLEIVQNEKDKSVAEHASLVTKLEALKDELNQMSDEKHLLQIRHGALTSESSELQRELSESRSKITDLQDKLDREKALALSRERDARDQYTGEIRRLSEIIEDIKAEMREKERLYDEDSDKWDSEKRTVEAQRDRAEEHATSLQRTISKLQEAEGTLSGREAKLQQALESEKERYEGQESLLTRQISELKEDLQSSRKVLEESRTELAAIKEELRLGQREQKSLLDKIEGLEDEVEILQASLDDEGDRAQDMIAAKQESDSLRKQLASLKQELARVEFVSANAKAEIDAFQGKNQTDTGSNDQLNSLLREHEVRLTQVRQDKQNLQDQLAKINIELHSTRSFNAEIKAERDEIQSQLRAMKQQEEETFRLDQERVDLRTAKMKLDNEVRRLREENKATTAQQKAVEKELQLELERSGAEEARLGSEIQELLRSQRGSHERRELASAKTTIQLLEERIVELECQSQLPSGENQTDFTSELSSVRRDLTAARQKESDYLRREASQKDAVRSLKRQISELERKVHDADISQLAVSSPLSSVGTSARKSELIEVRHQLASAHQSLKDLRSQLKEVERESARKLSAVRIDLQSQLAAWESDKDGLEHELDEIRYAKQELTAKNSANEATITRLRGKIDRLEKALQSERHNSGEDRTMALERRDLHEMLRETQIQSESLEVIVKEQEQTIATIATTENELRGQIKRAKEDRANQRAKITAAYTELDNLERKFGQARDDWEAEKKNLCKGVRFANMSLSVNEGGEELISLKKEAEERDKIHVKEIRGLMMSLDWLKARVRREENMREDAAFAKSYMAKRIKMYDLCNKADLKLLKSCTTLPLHIFDPPPKKPTIKGVATAIIAITRMKRDAAEWQKSKAVQARLLAQVELMKKEKARSEKRRSSGSVRN